jgi:hypothetical protein
MPIKITFDFGMKQIIIEGGEGDLIKVAQEVKSLAPQFSEIRILTEQIASNPQERQPSFSEVGPKAGSLRQFAKSLPLSNSYERIAAIAYYVIKIEKKPFFSVKEMSDWFGLCGFQKPALMPVALSDAKRKYGYVDNKGRDRWTISTAGENRIMELKEK